MFLVQACYVVFYGRKVLLKDNNIPGTKHPGTWEILSEPPVHMRLPQRPSP